MAESTTSKHCVSCGRDAPETAEVCPICGNRLRDWVQIDPRPPLDDAPWWLGWVGFITGWSFPIYAWWAYRRGRRDGAGRAPDVEPDPKFKRRVVGWAAAHFVPFLFLYASVHLPTICYQQGQLVGTQSTTPTSRRFTSLPTMLPLIVVPAAIIGWRVGLFSGSNAYDVNVGDCYAVGSVSLEVSCSEPHVGKVIAVWTVPDENLPTDAKFDELASEHCPAETEWYLYPSDFTWMEGDRNIVCLGSVE